MNSPHGQTRGDAGPLRGVRRLGPLLALCLLCARPASAQQYLTVYLNVSVGNDGTIYATGIADAGSMFEHSADISTGIFSPSRRGASAYSSVTSGGYARADTLLAPDETDTGVYTTTADGNANCPYAAGPASGSSSKSELVGYHGFTFKKTYEWDDYNGKHWGHYERCNPGTMCSQIDASPSEFNNSLPVYAVFYFSTFTDPILGLTSCVKRLSFRADSCVSDPYP